MVIEKGKKERIDKMKQIGLFHMNEKVIIKHTKNNVIYPYSNLIIYNLSSNMSYCYDAHTDVLF